MRRRFWTYLALISALLLLDGAVRAARRPLYGDVLRVETRARVFDLTPGADGVGAANRSLRVKLTRLVAEPLVALDAEGRPVPCVAASWTVSPDFRHWTFRLRPGLRFHDGSAVTAASVADVLESKLPGRRISASGGEVIIESDEPAPRLPAELSAFGREIWRRSEDGRILGTGPFRLEELDPGRYAAFLAFEDHWKGRPFLDGIVVQMGRPTRDQQIDLELGKADLVEISLDEVKRAAGRGERVILTRPLELMALVFEAQFAQGNSASLREALAVSIDRSAIQRVLLQRQGEAAWALLPEWLTGYAFLFEGTRDPDRARSLAGGSGAAPPALECAFESDDALAKMIAERIALDAQMAGIRLRVTAVPSPTAKPDVRLVRVPIDCADVTQALAETAGRLGLATPGDQESVSPQALFELERDLLSDRTVLPLFHLPLAYGVAKRLRAEDLRAVFEPGAWRLDLVWLDGADRNEAGGSK